MRARLGTAAYSWEVVVLRAPTETCLVEREVSQFEVLPHPFVPFHLCHVTRVREREREVGEGGSEGESEGEREGERGRGREIERAR